MIASGLLARFREDLRDTAAPYLWSDPEIYEYMDDAQKMLCRLAGGIADTPTIAVTAGDLEAPFDANILKIRWAYRGSDSKPLEVLNIEDLLSRRDRGDDYWQQHNYTLNSPPAPLSGLIVGMKDGVFRLLPSPIADDVINLVVYRMPAVPIVDGTEDFEIPSQHVIHLLLWMKYRAHMKQDAETYNKGKADEFKALFEDYCGMAKADREKLEHKFRTMAYGGY